MKKVLLTLASVLIIAHFSYAQWSTSTGTTTSIYNTALGNVGIGNPAPAYPLDILTNVNGTIAVNFVNSNTGSSARTRFVINNGSGSALINVNSPNYPPDPKSLSFWSPVGGAMMFNLTTGECLRIATTGNIGIGTTTPQERLSVVSGISTALGLYRSIASGNLSNGAIVGQINFGSFNSTSSTEVPGSEISGIATENWTQGSAQGSGIVFRTTPNTTTALAETMRLDNNGNLLIGKTSQISTSYKLDVNGNIRSNAITVNTNGADFVFEPAYKLFSLPEIEKYIQENHHLPEIPSAKQMQTDGLNVGDNEVKLLQKVEELTLYLIEKDKEIKAQQEEIDCLTKDAASNTDKQDIAILKEQITKLMELVKKN